MKTVEELRKLLEAGQTGYKPLNNISSGNITSDDGCSYPYEIVQGWDIGLAMQCDKEWGCFNMKTLDFIRQSDSSLQQKLLDSSQLEDAHWNWLAKHRCYHSDQYKWFFFIADGKPQGACLVYHPKKSVDTADTIFYIEFLAVAPWNRPNHICSQIFKGIGSLLLKTVISYAETELGITKGFSLHSLPKAEGYYQRIGMKRFEMYDKSGLGYFEMPELQKANFLGATA